MCRVLGVSRSGVYARRKRPSPSNHAKRDAQLLESAKAIHAHSRGTYGSPRVHAQMRREGIHVSRKRVERLMRANGLRGKIRRRFKKTTDSDHNWPLADNTLDRQFHADSPDTAWVTDITYIRTAAGWGYLATVLDLCTRMVVGWAFADHMRAELTVDALDAALGTRDPAKDLIHHSDRGSQYACAEYREKLEDLCMRASMSRKGNCWDNAVQESFFGTLKQEMAHEKRWANHQEARRDIHEYIEVFYNRQRLHSSLGYRTPAEVDQEHQIRMEEVIHTL